MSDRQARRLPADHCGPTEHESHSCCLPTRDRALLPVFCTRSRATRPERTKENYAMTQLHSTAVEIIADAHYNLTNSGSSMRSPTEACAYELDEVIQEASPEQLPTPVVQARDLCRNGGDVSEITRLLVGVLQDTRYDPADPESNHPKNN